MTFAQRGYLVDNKSAGDFLADGNVIQVLESEIVHSGGGTVVKGDFCYIPPTIGAAMGGFWGVAMNTPPATTDFVSVRVSGIFVLSVDSQDEGGNADIGFGDNITVNTDTGVLSRDESTQAQVVIGTALNSTTLTGASTETLITVLLSPPGSTNSNDRGVWQTRAFEIDSADLTTTNTTLITALENPNGLIVMAFIGRVTETIVGSSEDQMIIDLSDEDDNVLSQMTSTNTTPDVAGDLIQGTLTGFHGATGVALALIPAGKLAYVNLSQQTAGTPAGKIEVRVIVMSLT